MGWVRRLMGAMPASEMPGIALTNPGWVLSGVPDDAARFFRALPRLIRGDALLFLEGGTHTERLRSFLQEHNVSSSTRPALGTHWPRHLYFSIPVVPALLAELAALVEPLPHPQVCDHLHVFTNGDVLLSGYDAFSDPFYVSGAVDEERINAFSKAVACEYKRAEPAG